MWRTLVFLAEEFLVAELDALRHVLDCLRAVVKEVGETRNSFQLGQVFLKPLFRQVLVEQAVVPLVEGDAVVKRPPCRLDLSVELAVPSPAMVELEFERPVRHVAFSLLGFGSCHWIPSFPWDVEFGFTKKTPLFQNCF